MSKASGCSLRLQRDIADLFKDPLEGIRVKLHGDNMHRMCLILSPTDGPFNHINLHLDVTIPDTFPADPPKVTIQTLVPHPNVFAHNYICCDILKGMKTIDYNGGYSPAYLLKYVFLQLLSFFSSKYIEQDFGNRVSLNTRMIPERLEDKVKSFSCKHCEFEGVRSREKTITIATQNAHSSSQCGFDKLNVDCCLKITDQLSHQEILTLSQLHGGVKQVVNMYNVLLKKDLCCFYPRNTFEESVLGIGIWIPTRYATKTEAPTVTTLDLFSHEAFSVHGLRHGIWGEEFSCFLPVALSDEHFIRGEAILKNTLETIYSTTHSGVAQRNYSTVILGTLPKLMNTMVLNLVNECGKWRHNEIKKASEKAIQGYCLLYHLFSKLASHHSEVGAFVQTKVQAFMENENKRRKGATPDLGEFLVYLLLAKNLEWSNVCNVFLEELLSRNVFWYLEDNPHLAYLEPNNYLSQLRLFDTFKASLTSLRLVMFQVCFFNVLRSQLNEKIMLGSKLVDMIDHRYGIPSQEMSSRLFELIKGIYEVSDFAGFLKVVGYKASGTLEWHICGMLKQAVRSSENKGYHAVPYTLEELYWLRYSREPNCPAPDGYKGVNMAPMPGRSFRPGKCSLAPSIKRKRDQGQERKGDRNYKLRRSDRSYYHDRNRDRDYRSQIEATIMIETGIDPIEAQTETEMAEVARAMKSQELKLDL